MRDEREALGMTDMEGGEEREEYMIMMGRSMRQRD
jgi:hypothetical protein